MESQSHLNNIREVRKREGITIRTMIKRLGITKYEYEKLEADDKDLKISELQRIQAALCVPLQELITPADEDPSFEFITDRVHVLRAYKSAMSLQKLLASSGKADVKRMLERLIADLLVIFPELDGHTINRDDSTGVHGWPIGHRRTNDNPGDLGKTALNPVPEQFFFEHASNSPAFSLP